MCVQHDRLWLLRSRIIGVRRPSSVPVFFRCYHANMTREANSPSLQINYSPKFALTLSLSRAQDYSKKGASFVEYFCKVALKILHPTGHFEYQADNICFDRQAFERFAADLRSLGAGDIGYAVLREVGEMFSFKLERKGHRLHAALVIREYQPEDKETSLSAGFEVEYDLFVNKLAADTLAFAQDLKKVRPEEV